MLAFVKHFVVFCRVVTNFANNWSKSWQLEVVSRHVEYNGMDSFVFLGNLTFTIENLWRLMPASRVKLSLDALCDA